METEPFPMLFSPFDLAGVEVPNRVVMPPMSTGLAGESGEVTAAQLAFYRERVVGGVGMIIVEFTSVHRVSGISEHRQLSLEDERNLDGHRELVRMIRSHGSVACLQLQHGGPFARREFVEGGVARGPVNIPSKRHPSGLGVKALDDAELEHLIECFGRTAELAVAAGYQAIELHGAHGYLLTSFLSPYTNHRNDAWGGDEERRLHFPASVIRRVKRAIGSVPLLYRVSADEFVAGGLSIDDMERIAPKLVAAGADALHVSTGIGNGSFDKVLDPMSAPEGWRLPYSRRLRAASGVPVITVGQIRWPATAERALREGDADLIAIGRPLLADPAWAAKARAGRVRTIRPCTSCNFCVALGDSGQGVGCAENPRTGHELDPPLSAGARRGERAVVVGAGPGGMVAALMLDQAGFRTELHEAREQLGGGLIASAAPPFKDKLLWYLQYLKDELARSSVDIRLGKRVDVELLKQERPAVLMLADGANAAPPPIPGLSAPIVFDAYEALMGDESWRPESTAVPLLVYGGGETGCETAEYLAERGYRVVLVTRSDAKQLARAAERVYRMVLLRRLQENQRIEIRDHCTLASIDSSGVVLVDQAGIHSSQPAARVFIAQGRRPSHSELNSGTDFAPIVLAIGDSRQCGRIGDAVRDAYQAIKSICVDGVPPKPLLDRVV
ncbi:MAG: NAD(P)/FAD-dependent oxidoreductase [Gammaproteobacteria bacterium]|nr:NAD(P)/FAD-dependent oxidoreductase [Gammaproteobacteria bacterium]